MAILTIKTAISFLFLVLTLVAVFTMFEVLGRKEKRFDAGKLTRVHRANGILFFFTLLALGCLGMTYIILTKAELSPRAALHVMLAHGVLFLLLFKVAVVKIYRQFYTMVPAVGILMAFLALGTVASSSGYYILSRAPVWTISRQETVTTERRVQVPDVRKGKELFLEQCSRCHDAGSDSTPGSQGMKGIFKRPVLPFTGRPPSAENIVRQLRTPYKGMPPFPHLTEAEMNDLIAYMKEL